MTVRPGRHMVALFATHIAAGMDPAKAARKVDGKLDLLMNHVNLTDSLIAALYKRLSCEMAPKALHTIATLLNSPDDRVKLAAAKTIIDKALPNVRQEAATDSKDLATLSVAELAVLVDTLEGELAGRAKDVTPQSPDADQAKLLIMLE